MKLGKDVIVYLKTTGTCNLNCSHCFTSGSKGKRITYNPEAAANFLIKVAKENQLHSMRVQYHGGEPMLCPLEKLYSFYNLTNKKLPNVSYGIQTNLVYTLNDDKRNFFNTVFQGEGIGTSWDSNIRFGTSVNKSKEKDLLLWEKNVRTLVVDDNSDLTLMISLSKHFIENFTPYEAIQYAIDLGFKYILFERITVDGNAEKNKEIIPLNREIDKWLFQMYEDTLKYNLHKKIGNMFLEEIATAYTQNLHVANRCRGCEQKIITINADGSIAGCPNSATGEEWSHLGEGPEGFVKSPARIDAICKEALRKPECYTCEVSSLCNGDCYKLSWDETGCAAPKSLFKHLKSNQLYNELIPLMI